MTPYEIEVLLHYYYSPEEWRDIDAPAFRESVKKLIAYDLLKFSENPSDGATYQTTERGQYYVKALCSVPLPKQSWVIEWEGVKE